MVATQFLTLQTIFGHDRSDKLAIKIMKGRNMIFESKSKNRAKSKAHRLARSESVRLIRVSRHLKKKRQCAVCLRRDVKLHHCSACRNAVYCSVECQRVEYEQHAQFCRRSRKRVVVNLDEHFDAVLGFWLNVAEWIFELYG